MNHPAFSSLAFLALVFGGLAACWIAVGLSRLFSYLIRHRHPVVTGGRVAQIPLPASGLVTLRGFNPDHKE